MKIKIKKEFQDTKIGFNNSTKPLKERKDLVQLAELAIRSNDRSLLNLFETIPTLEELQKAKTKKIVDDVKSKK